jgi:D-serine deaminase-like pyridoxal phosphate-dependent protein
MQLDAGITKFKCATLAEVKMVAETGGKDILLSYPLVGPGVDYFCRLMKKFPEVRLSIITDNIASCRTVETTAVKMNLRIPVFIDIDNGMHRTGIEPGDEAAWIAESICHSENLSFAGLHVYDGHTRETDFESRKKIIEKEFEPVLDFVARLRNLGIPVEEMVCGGSPSFPVHALFDNRTLSPGTTLLWDEGYGSSFSDIGIQPAAVVASRIVSKPLGKFLCLDLGHKAIGSEKQPPRVKFFGIKEYKTENHSEEHLVISTENHTEFSIGQVVYGIPLHICPTMALHDKVYVVEKGRVTDKWRVIARNRIY